MGKIEQAGKSHKFAVGQKVILKASRFERVLVSGTFEVTARLPAEDGEPQYRIRHGRDAFERRVGEHRLALAA